MLPSLVADVNIAPTVIQFLRECGIDVVSAREEGWSRYEDRDILREAHEMGRFVLTHDSDFSKLAVIQNQAFAVSSTFDPEDVHQWRYLQTCRISLMPRLNGHDSKLLSANPTNCSGYV